MVLNLSVEWNVTPAVIANPETYLDPAAVQQELGQFRFTFYPFSSQPNSGIQPILNYNPPASPDDRFRELEIPRILMLMLKQGH